MVVPVIHFVRDNKESIKMLSSELRNAFDLQLIVNKIVYVCDIINNSTTFEFNS